MARKKHPRHTKRSARLHRRSARGEWRESPTDLRVPRPPIDPVEVASLESFPASDPPGYYSGHA